MFAEDINECETNKIWRQAQIKETGHVQVQKENTYLLDVLWYQMIKLI